MPIKVGIIEGSEVLLHLSVGDRVYVGRHLLRAASPALASTVAVVVEDFTEEDGVVTFALDDTPCIAWAVPLFTFTLPQKRSRATERELEWFEFDGERMLRVQDEATGQVIVLGRLHDMLHVHTGAAVWVTRPTRLDLTKAVVEVWARDLFATATRLTFTLLLRAARGPERAHAVEAFAVPGVELA